MPEGEGAERDARDRVTSGFISCPRKERQKSCFKGEEVPDRESSHPERRKEEPATIYRKTPGECPRKGMPLIPLEDCVLSRFLAQRERQG